MSQPTTAINTSKPFLNGLNLPITDLDTPETVNEEYINTHDPASCSIQTMEKISNNLWHYLTNLNAVFPNSDDSHHQKYTDCGYTTKALLAAFLGKEASSDWKVHVNELNELGTSKYNQKRCVCLKARIKKNSQRNDENVPFGFIYRVFLQPIKTTDITMSGHLFVIEQLPRKSPSDEKLFFVHQSYIQEYTFTSNRLRMNDGEPLTEEQLTVFLNDLETIVSVHRWNQYAVEAYQRCFNVDMSRYIGKNVRSGKQINGIMDFEVHKYNPNNLEKILKDLIPEKKDSESSRTRKYADLSHEVTALQLSPDFTDFKYYLKTAKKMYLLVNSGQPFDFKKAYDEIYRISLERDTHPMLHESGLRKIDAVTDTMQNAYETIWSSGMPRDIKDFMIQVDMDYKKVVNYHHNRLKTNAESLVHAIAHFGRKKLYGCGYRIIPDDFKVLDFIIKIAGEEGKTNMYNGTKLVKDLKEYQGVLREDFQVQDGFSNYPDRKTHMDKWSELNEKYSKLQSWYKGVVSMNAVGDLCLIPLKV